MSERADDTQLSFRKGLPWVVFLVAMVFLAMYSRLIIAPLLVTISTDLGISYAEATDFFLLMSLGFASALLMSGFVSSIIRHRGAIVVSGLLAGISLVLSGLVDSKAALGVCMVFLGVGPGLYAGSGLPVVSDLIRPGDVAKAVAVHELGPNLGFMLSPLAVAIFEPLVGWRSLLIVSGLVSIVVSVLYAIFARGGARRGEPPRFRTVGEYLRNTRFLALVAVFALAAAAAFGVYQVLPGYLVVHHGMSEPFVNTIVGISRASGAVAILIAGAMSDRIGHRRIVTVSYLITAVLTLLLGLLSGPALVIVVFLQPLVVPAFFPAAFAALNEVSQVSSRNVAVALVITMANVMGNGVFPRMAGAFEAVNAFPVSFIVLGGVMVAGGLLIPRISPR